MDLQLLLPAGLRGAYVPASPSPQRPHPSQPLYRSFIPLAIDSESVVPVIISQTREVPAKEGTLLFSTRVFLQSLICPEPPETNVLFTISCHGY